MAESDVYTQAATKVAGLKDALNAAITEAEQLGLRIEAEVDHVQSMSVRWPRPIVNVYVLKDLTDGS